MTRPFDRLNVDTQGFDISDYNRLADSVQRQTSSQGAGLPMIDSSAGTGSYMRGDVSRMFMIQVSGVVTATAAGIPVVPAYDWTEVVRADGVYHVPGDARTGTVTTFPAFDTQMSPNVTLNIGSTTSAYLANLSWDERSLEFVGKDAATGGSSGGVVPTFCGVSLWERTTFRVYWDAPTGRDLHFTDLIFDTNSFFDPANPTYVTVPFTAYYQVGFSASVPTTAPVSPSIVSYYMRAGNGIVWRVIASAIDPNAAGGLIFHSTEPALLNAGERVALNISGSGVGNLCFLDSVNTLHLPSMWLVRIGV